jgi:predicted outer membrane lipoprotein
LFWNDRSIPFLGGASIVVDLLVVGQIIPVATTLLTVWRVRKQLESGAIQMPSSAQSHAIRRLLPLPIWMRVIVLGIHGLLAAIGVIAALWLASMDTMSFWPYVLLQGVFGGLLAAYAAVLSAHRLIADAAAEQPFGRKVHGPSGAPITGIHP